MIHPRAQREKQSKYEVEALFAGSRLEQISLGEELSGRRPLVHSLLPCGRCSHCQPNYCGLKHTGWARRLIGIAAPIIAAAILSVYSAINGLGESFQELGRAQAVMQTQLGEMRTSMQGIYLWRDAEQKHEDHEQRLRKLETRR